MQDNPKPQKGKLIERRELTYKDWEKGLFSGPFEVGKSLIINGRDNKYYISLSLIEFNKIRAKQEEIYNEKVDQQADYLIVEFKKRYEGSSEKERLLNAEIDNYEKLLLAEKMPIYIPTNIDTPIENLPYDSIDICEIRKLFEKIIVGNKKDYSLTQSPNYPATFGAADFHYIRVEAIVKYYYYLKDLRAKYLPESRKTFLQDKKIHKKKTEGLFEDYLSPEGKKILPKLIIEYENAKPADIAYMVYAMIDLTTLFSKRISNSSTLHRLLTNTFGDIGTLQVLTGHMRKLKEGRTDYQDAQIAIHIAKIKAMQ